MEEKQKILVVDDDPNVTASIRRGLIKGGYEVIQVNDPLKVEEYLLYTQLSLVITDLRMPGMDGLKVLELIKKSQPDLPVIFLTGDPGIESAVQATKGGAVEYLAKPFDNQKLLELVKKHARLDHLLPADVKEALGADVFQEEATVVEPDKILLKDEIVSSDTVPDGLVELKFEDILPGQILPFALYLQIYNKKNQRHYLRKICQENTVFTSGLKEILLKRQLGSAFIRERDYGAFLEYFNAIKSSPSFRHKQIKEGKKLLLYGKAIEAVTEILSDPIVNEKIKSGFDLVDDIFRTIVDDPYAYQDMFKLFNRDTNVFNHSANTCLLAVSFGHYLELEVKQVKALGFGALFHDLGMNRVDRTILEKPGPLTPLEWAEVKKHPERGFALLRPSPIVSAAALRVVLEHHEQEDGSGYPRGIKGDQISFLARLCRTVDKFDAMTTNKPYRDTFTAAQALKHKYQEEPSENIRKVIRRFTEFLGGKKPQEARDKS